MDRRRSDQHQEGGDTAAEKEAPDKKRESSAQQIKQEQKEEQEQEDNRVHEITESSSDESADEAPATKTDTLKPVEASTAANAEEKMTDQAMVEQIRAGVYMPEPEELYATKNVADMHYLFTNDKLKEQPAMLVLRSDPFCIPRVTDNVTNYRPMLNPLSIFMGEEKLLPGNFRLDPSERPPNVASKVAEKQDAADAHHRRTLPIPPGSSAPLASGPNAFRGKTSAFMGTLPRQTEFAEIPVSEKLFQHHEHTLDVTTSASDNVTSLDSAADGATSMAGTTSVSMGCQIQQLQPLDSIAETLTNYLPARNLSTTTADSRALDEHYFDAPTAYSHANVSMGMATGNGTFNSLLSPAETPYVGLFEEEGGQQQGMQSFSSALGSISIITPTNAGAGIPAAIITPQGCAVGSSEGTPRRSSAKKPRAKNVFRPCTAPGCTKGARGKSGLCQKHGGGKRCAMLNCPKGAQGSSSLCLFHGGGYRCTADGCTTGARGTSGLCAKHGGYKKGKTSSSKRGPDTNASVAKRARTTEPSAVDS
ncbi:hypothetical protein BBJ29_002473 [Phytophthora kernoviae]|uniref:Uncharacterized protein n=1 Tax=Phytophthora kernoviae TaxID=325452 RepID=A0A3F2RYJ5_9STRA|nr:hypothetical protein BBJ29_002473 [Phytophthora kernoviae]RLN66808.1 hypothetical protein BBP00_00001991 [Phytophthora kernoviae]